MSKPLALSTFSIDQLENALYHKDQFSPCVLLTEVHAALLNVIRRDHKDYEQPRVYPLKAFEPEIEPEESDERQSSPGGSEDEFQQIRMGLISEASMEMMEAWEGRELTVANGRKDWQKSLVGCLWAVSMLACASALKILQLKRLSSTALNHFDVAKPPRIRSTPLDRGRPSQTDSWTCLGIRTESTKIGKKTGLPVCFSASRLQTRDLGLFVRAGYANQTLSRCF